MDSNPKHLSNWSELDMSDEEREVNKKKYLAGSHPFYFLGNSDSDDRGILTEKTWNLVLDTMAGGRSFSHSMRSNGQGLFIGKARRQIDDIKAMQVGFKDAFDLGLQALEDEILDYATGMNESKGVIPDDVTEKRFKYDALVKYLSVYKKERWGQKVTVEGFIDLRAGLALGEARVAELNKERAIEGEVVEVDGG